MGRKTPISFSLRKVLQRPVVSALQNSKTKRATTQTTLFLV